MSFFLSMLHSKTHHRLYWSVTGFINVSITLYEYKLCSLGGAIAIHTASCGRVPNLKGLAVIDVVEGTAIAALKFMQGILRARPAAFESHDDAIVWRCVSCSLLFSFWTNTFFSLRTNALRNMESAKLSIPSQLRPLESGDGFEWRTPLELSADFWKVSWWPALSLLLVTPFCRLVHGNLR